MRYVFAILVGFIWTAEAIPQKDKDKDKPAKRYQVEPNLEAYPQEHPKTTLASALKAIERKRIDYLLAHLADPRFVDTRVKIHNNSFDALVKETASHFAEDPTLIKELKRYLKEGEWEADEKVASVYYKDNKAKRAFFKKIGDRWFLENRQASKAK